MNAPQWNGEPCEAAKGSVIVGASQRPTWWCPELEGQRRKCVRVTYQGETFFIDDEDGSGSRKVFEEGGGPMSYHASIPVDDPASFQAEQPDGRVAKFMTCTKEFRTHAEGGTPVTVKEGQIITVESADFGLGQARVHFGGMLRGTLTIDELLQHSRIADPSEFQRTVKHCQRCDRMEVEPGKWLPKPPCFNPRPGVKIVAETCPDCDR